MRADALLAAAKAIAAATGSGATASLATDGDYLCCMDSSPKSANVVPSQVTFTADCRSSDIRSLNVAEAFRETLRESTEHCPDLSFEIIIGHYRQTCRHGYASEKIIEDALMNFHVLDASVVRRRSRYDEL